MKLNGEHLKEMERKFVCVEIPSFYLYDTSGSSVCFRRKEREEEEEKEKDNPSKKKRKRVQPHRQNLASNTAIEAMEKIIHVSIEIFLIIYQTTTLTEMLKIYLHYVYLFNFLKPRHAVNK